MTKFIEIDGYCPICEERATFSSDQEWLRDHFLCSGCGSIPRERALMHVIKMYYPNFRDLRIHESSPERRGASRKLSQECKDYTASHYFEDLAAGEYHREQECRCENLESLTFQDGSLDLVITQDVVEHILRPDRAFKEIARVLKPGGAHIFTVPLVNKDRPSECWASMDESGQIIYHHDPEYHGNPIDDNGSLVTMHWGYDIADYIMRAADTPTTIIMIDNLSMGIRAEYTEVLVSRKAL